MATIGIDTKGDYLLPLPERIEDIMHCGSNILQCNAGLPAAKRLPEEMMTQMSGTVEKVTTARTTAENAEIERAKASERYRQAITAVKPKLDIVYKRLIGKYATNLADLEEWGLATKIGRGGKTAVHKPSSQKERNTFLAKYVAKETNLPVDQRIADPPLTEMATFAEQVRLYDEARHNNQNTREAYTQTSTQTIASLSNQIYLTATYLVVVRYNDHITQDLQRWGFEVIARPPKHTPPAEPETPAEE